MAESSCTPEPTETEAAKIAAFGFDKPAPRAFDMSKYQRVVGIDSPRVSGSFRVLKTDGNHETWVHAIEVTIWFDNRHWGRTLYSNDLTGSVRNGKAELSKHMVASSKLADVEDVWDEMLECLEAADAAFPIAEAVLS